MVRPYKAWVKKVVKSKVAAKKMAAMMLMLIKLFLCGSRYHGALGFIVQEYQPITSLIYPS